MIARYRAFYELLSASDVYRHGELVLWSASLSPVGDLGCLAIDQIAQSGLSSLKVIYYLAQLFSARRYWSDKRCLLIILALAEIERDLLLECAHLGIARVKAAGKRFGHPSVNKNDRLYPKRRRELLC